MIYSNLIRPLAFRFDPETAHHLAIAAGARLGWAAQAMRACATGLALRPPRLFGFDGTADEVPG